MTTLTLTEKRAIPALVGCHPSICLHDSMGEIVLVLSDLVCFRIRGSQRYF